MPEKPYDVKRAHPELYPSGKTATREFALVDVPEQRFLAVDGSGDPNTAEAYRDAVEALYGLAYTLKFWSRREHGRDSVVAPLEGLWRADDPAAFVTRDKASWRWTMLLVQPEWIDDAALETARESVRAKKRADAPPALDLVTLRVATEGLSTQILHIGSYDDEGPTLTRLHDEWMPRHEMTFNGDHHEIYLSDPRRTAPEKLKTVLRQPVRRVGTA